MGKMVDISSKDIIIREAKASGKIILKSDTIKKIKNGEIKKGDPLKVAEVAAINAVKQTQLLIPYCHQIPISAVEVDFNLENDQIEAFVFVKANARTGVEMEAIVGVSMALNTIWDMVKYLEKDEDGQYPSTRIDEIKVLEKIKRYE